MKDNMMRRARILTLAALGIGVLVSACAVPRPPSAHCPALSLYDQTMSLQEREEVTASMLANAMIQRPNDTPSDTGPITIRVISLSAGGQFGAFGAGFLEGWSQNAEAPRPHFDVVTGVSAGALLAPIAFAGSRFDETLRYYRGLSDSGVTRRRNILSLGSAPSLRSPAPLEAFVEDALSVELINEISLRHSRGDQLLISATNLDTTEGVIFDLGSAASAQHGGGVTCLKEAMLASSAIPGILPPRHINNALYADGGLREQVFFRAVDTARVRLARETGRKVKVEAYLIVNGALRPPDVPTPNSLLDYIGRGVETLADEVLRDSITDAVDFSTARPEWELFGIVARTGFPDCDFETLPSGTFDPCVTRTLYDAGRDAGRRVPINWLSAEELSRIATEL